MEMLGMPERLGADAVADLAWVYASSYLTFHSDIRSRGMGYG